MIDFDQTDKEIRITVYGKVHTFPLKTKFIVHVDQDKVSMHAFPYECSLVRLIKNQSEANGPQT